jgi:hypothetical protein
VGRIKIDRIADVHRLDAVENRSREQSVCIHRPTIGKASNQHRSRHLIARSAK